MLTTGQITNKTTSRDNAAARVPRCDFNCGRKDEKLLQLRNTNGHMWNYHMSCMRDHIDVLEELHGEKP